MKESIELQTQLYGLQQCKRQYESICGKIGRGKPSGNMCNNWYENGFGITLTERVKCPPMRDLDVIGLTEDLQKRFKEAFLKTSKSLDYDDSIEAQICAINGTLMDSM